MRTIPPMTRDPDVVHAVPTGSGPGWVREAARRGASTDKWFDARTAAAIAVCRTCPVAGPSLEYALAERLTHGVWGGMDGGDRAEVAAARGIVWEPDPPPARTVCSCGRWARPQRTMCAACQQARYRASRR